MHWVDVNAERLLARAKAHVIESGTSISGEPHLGSALDIIVADGIHKSVIEHGGKSRSIWAMDDMDGLRKVPPQLPREFDEYLGKPAFTLPCPDGCCGSFVEHFTRPFVADLARIDVEPEPVSVAKMYREGKYDGLVRTALERSEEIKEILRETSGSEREGDWLPFFPICGNCGKILTTQAYEYSNGKVGYRCQGGTAGKNFIAGCGHEGEVGIREGKLPWRVEWAARWSHLGVTCEPMGKDLTAAGGTYETSKVLCERVFNSPAPEPLPYEWILDEHGQRLGKSLGRIITLREIIDILTPEVTRYFFFRTQPTSHKVMDFRQGIPKLAEEHEQARKLYYGLEVNVPEKEIEDVKRSFELSQTGDVPRTYFDVPYSHLISIVQTYQDFEQVIRTLERTDHLTGLTEENRQWLETKVQAVRSWLRDHAPESMLFSVQEKPPNIEVTKDQQTLLARLLTKLETLEWTADGIHNTVHDTAVENEVKAGDMFKLMYRIFLGQDRGPRLGYLLASLDREFVLGRTKHFSE